jgi:formylglycine-generating enzyme required for sulfatase activity
MIYLSLRGVASKWRELLSSILVMFLLWNHAIAQTPASKETTLQDAINALAEAQGEWSAALAEADDALLDKYAVESRDAAKKLAAEAETKAAVGDAALAMSRYRMAVKVLKEASAKALTAENTTKAAPVVLRMEATMAGGDKFAAEDTLAELEKLIPSDLRMPGFREKVAAMPGPEKAETYDLGGGVKLEMILIRPGSFMMGSDNGDTYEKPAHKVKITKPFYMGKFEVTQAQYQAVMGSNPSNFKGEGNLPVEIVSWDDCQAFLKKLNEKIPGKELRLPTEAEWEFACRAGSTMEYCFGDSENNLGEYAWFTSNSGQKTHPVGGKKPNAWGLYDMHGNVWEWCNDSFGDKYYESSPAEDPKGADSGAVRVLRGGSWNIEPGHCRSANRFGFVPSYRFSVVGFRVSCSSSAR